MAINIDITLDSNFFEANEEERLKKIFKDEFDEELEDTLSKIVFAALEEYKEMFIGKGVPSPRNEILEHRLFYLIKRYYPENKFPSETEVSTLFQLTPAKSRNLIRSVLIKFKYQLQENFKKALKNTIINDKNPKKDDNNDDMCKLYIPSDNVIEELNRIIEKRAKKNTDLDKIRKYPNSSRIYWISRTSYEELCDELQVTKPVYPTEFKS